MIRGQPRSTQDKNAGVPVVDQQGVQRAWWLDANPLAADWTVDPALAAYPVIVWSGWLGDNPFAADPRAWGGEAERALDAVVQQCAAGPNAPELWLRPHARHVLGDAHRVARFLERNRGLNVGLALDPLALLEDSMLPKAEDHLERIFQRLAPIAAAYWLGRAFAGGECASDALVAHARTLAERFSGETILLVEE